MQDSLFYPKSEKQRCCEAELIKRLTGRHSTLFQPTADQIQSPAGRMVLRLTAKVRTTSGSGCTSVQTPKCPSGGGQVERMTEGGGLRKLEDQVLLASCPTPMAGSPATETYNAAGNSDYSRRIVELASMPTPCAMELDTDPEKVWERKQRLTRETGVYRGNSCGLGSKVQLAQVTTPSARDWKDTSGMSESGVDPDGSTRSRLDQLPRQAQLAASGQTATGGTAATGSIGQLDPAYSRWLMGVPPEWDAFACTATRLLSRRRKRSSKP